MRVRIDNRGSHLLVEVQGRFHPASAQAAVNDIFAACAAGSLTRVLIDARGLEETVTVADRFDLGRVLAERRLGPVKFAVLVLPSQMVVKTLENSATNRGVPVRTTASVEEAYGFLEIPPPA